MDERIKDIDPATGESRGYYAIDPSGHLITIGRTQSIKDGFRYATRGEITRAKELVVMRSGKAVAVITPAVAETIAIIEAAPPELKSPAAFVESDIEPSPSDQD